MKLYIFLSHGKPFTPTVALQITTIFLQASRMGDFLGYDGMICPVEGEPKPEEKTVNENQLTLEL